jgi:hypothetical protein
MRKIDKVIVRTKQHCGENTVMARGRWMPRSTPEADKSEHGIAAWISTRWSLD